jgi:hypothetical protein
MIALNSSRIERPRREQVLVARSEPFETVASREWAPDAPPAHHHRPIRTTVESKGTAGLPNEPLTTDRRPDPLVPMSRSRDWLANRWLRGFSRPTFARHLHRQRSGL